MIPETGYVTARFADTYNGSPVEWDDRVVAWDDKGNALVPDLGTGRLAVAHERPGFQRLVVASTDTGWCASCKGEL